MKHYFCVSILVALVSPTLVRAETKRPIEDIVVTGAYNRSQIDILQSTSVLKTEALQRDMRATIGDTLLKLPGISASRFGPAASRPVIRGQQGERVRVLTDGIGSIDASNTSVDHAVAGETLTAERVDVLRGPATLMFGSSGIGGVVNIIDGRMPATLQSETYRGAVTALFGSAQTSGAFQEHSMPNSRPAWCFMPMQAIVKVATHASVVRLFQSHWRQNWAWTGLH